MAYAIGSLLSLLLLTGAVASLVHSLARHRALILAALRGEVGGVVVIETAMPAVPQLPRPAHSTAWQPLPLAA